jgi:actin-related protein 4
VSAARTKLRVRNLTVTPDEVAAIVLDPGYSSIRAGFAGEDVPKSVCPSFYGQIDSDSGSQYLFGENAIHTP